MLEAFWIRVVLTDNSGPIAQKCDACVEFPREPVGRQESQN